MIKAAKLLFLSLLVMGASSASGAVLWSNGGSGVFRASDGSVVSTSDISVSFNKMFADASANVFGTGSEIIPYDAATLPLTMTEVTSASDIAAAVAFLPEAALYAVAGATIGELIWNSTTGTYQVQPTTPASQQTYTCPDGSLETFPALTSTGGNTTVTSPGAWVSDQNSFTIHNQGQTFSFLSIANYNSDIMVSINGTGDYVGATGSCPSSGIPEPTPNNQPPQDIPPSLLPPYILPWRGSPMDRAGQIPT